MSFVLLSLTPLTLCTVSGTYWFLMLLSSPILEVSYQCLNNFNITLFLDSQIFLVIKLRRLFTSNFFMIILVEYLAYECLLPWDGQFQGMCLTVSNFQEFTWKPGFVRIQLSWTTPLMFVQIAHCKAVSYVILWKIVTNVLWIIIII